jgi:hypothetical protein
MRYQIKEPLKAKTLQGEIELQAGQVITLPEDKAIRLIEAGKVRPVSESMLEQYKALIQWLKSYQMTIEDIKEADIELYDSILTAVENTDKAFYSENLQGFTEGVYAVKQLYKRAMERTSNNEHS